MTFIDKLSRVLLTPPATGKKAVFYGFVLISIPTVTRLLLDDLLSQLPFITYLPFVIVAAMVLAWRYAAITAVVSWLAADLLFMSPQYQLTLDTREILGFVVFQGSAALVIALVETVRTIVENSLRPIRPGGFAAPVVFSERDGQAWASWYGSHSWVRLGPEEEVAEMMTDFLAQRELGKRLVSNLSQ
jgi:hypothetical protein